MRMLMHWFANACVTVCMSVCVCTVQVMYVNFGVSDVVVAAMYTTV